jgi:N-acetylneuraminic acid mutarotase
MTRGTIRGNQLSGGVFMRIVRRFLPTAWLCMFLVGFAGISLPAAAQTTAPNEWTWVGGSNTGSPYCTGCLPGVFGTLGVPATGNIPNGRWASVTWIDGKGNFWLFGGVGSPVGDDSLKYNDLWEFNPSTNEWAWMAGSSTGSQSGVYGTLGIPSAENVPGSREDASGWTDNEGNLWLFGGYGADASGTNGILNDLWEFNPSTGEWTWMSGSSTVGNSCFTYDIGEKVCARPSVYGTLGTPAAGNTPGSREGAISWTDNKGNLWLFGGWSYDISAQVQYYFDELWEYNPSANQWAWMGGSSTRDGSACIPNVNLYYLTCGEPGVYGTIGTPAAGNSPGGRASAAKWTDSQGNFWLFSGSGFDVNGDFGDPNDLWEFNPSTVQWTWRGGNNEIPPCDDYDCSAPAVYGTLGTPAAGNVPLGRDHSVTWTDSSGNLWLFGGGGEGIPIPRIISEWMDDLWEFNPSTNEWALMGGNIQSVCGVYCSSNPGAVYGELGVPAPGDGPGSRFAPAGWTDSNGNLWLFGGQLDVVEVGYIFFNDLWEYQPSTAALPTTTAPTFSLPTGSYPFAPSVTLNDDTNGAFIYYATDGTTPTINSIYGGSPTVNPTVSLPIINIWHNETLKAIAVANGCLTSAVAIAVYTVPPPTVMPTISVGSGINNTQQSVTISDTTPGATIYYAVNAIPTESSTVYTGPIIVTSSETIYAIAIAIGYRVSDVANSSYTPNQTATPTFNVPAGTYGAAQLVSISDSNNEAHIYYTIDGTTPTTNSPWYTGPITVSSSETLQAIAQSFEDTISAVASAAYTITPPAATPIFSTASGTYASPQSVTLSDTTPNATIYYTTNGTTPTTTSTVYSGPIPVNSTETIEAIATASGYSTSAVASATYTINLPAAATPTFSVAAGTYAANQSVALSDSTVGATIYYTTNGTTPTTSSTVYSGPIPVMSTETIEAIAAASGYSNSAVASATYTIPQSFTLSLNPTSMTVQAGQSGTTTITAQDEEGFNGNVSFACSGLPAGAACSFAIDVAPTPPGVAYTTLTVSTSSTTAEVRRGSRPLLPGAAVAVVLCCFGLRERRRLLMVVLLGVSAAGLGVLGGCGGAGSGGGGGGGSQPVTSTVTVTATSGTLQQTATFSLTVN